MTNGKTDVQTAFEDTVKAVYAVLKSLGISEKRFKFPPSVRQYGAIGQYSEKCLWL